MLDFALHPCKASKSYNECSTPDQRMSRKYKLKNRQSGKVSQMDALSGTIGPDVINIASLTKDQGVFTFDPGFMATASTESKIPYIDADPGVLWYRGYP